MYKMIAIDLDGTLLDSYGNISTKNIQALEQAVEKGSEIVISSGRIFDSTKNFSDEINGTRYIISGNGSIVYDKKEKKTLYSNCIPKEKVLEIIDICDENSIYYSIYTNKGIIAKSLNYNVLFYQNENIAQPDEKKISIDILENIREYIETTEGEQYSKISICDKDEIVFSNILKKLKQIDGAYVLDIAHMSRKFFKQEGETLEVKYFYTEITSENVNKWTAIEYLLSHLGINKEDVMCIGDNVNDLEMIQNAGLGVLMGNANPLLKDASDIVVSTNNEGGVAEAIEKYN